MARFKSAENISNGEKNVGIIRRGVVCGMGAAAAASLFFGVSAGTASADKCYIVGGMGDPSGEWAQDQFASQGSLNSCNEGVERVEYSASIWPLGPDRMVDSVAPAVDDLTNRLNNTPAWQHKRVLAFSEGTEVAAQSGNNTYGTNITVELNGGPQGRTGAFHSPLVTDIPLVEPIIQAIGIPTDTTLNQRPGVNYVRNYNEGDGYANLGAQGNNFVDAIPGALGIATEMVQNGAHAIPDQNVPHETFVDGDGIVNNVWRDENPYTQIGSENPAVMAPPAPATAPAESSPIPSFWGEAPCVAQDGSQYFTPGEAAC